jgi:hypothetical protein
MHSFWQIVSQNRRDRGPVLAAVSLYLLSCCLPAGRTPGTGYESWENTYPGAVLLVSGFTWICGCMPLSALEKVWEGKRGEVGQLCLVTLINWPSWLANPLFWCGIWQFRKGNRLNASLLAGTAAVLALLFFGSQWIWDQRIWELPGYYVWVASFFVLAGSGLIPREATSSLPGGR